MLYLWKIPECPNKHIAAFERNVSPDRFLLLQGIKLDAEEVSRCYCYLRSTTLDLPDDPLIRIQLRHYNQRAFIFTPNELFYCAGGDGEKITIDADDLHKLKATLSLIDNDMDKAPKILSDEQLKIVGSVKGCPTFSRKFTLNLDVTQAVIKKYDAIPNNTSSPLVNHKIMDILLSLAPAEVQFFEADIYCKDGILKEYQLLNITKKIKGIDYTRSVYSMMEIPDSEPIPYFRSIAYKPNCLGQYKIARDEKYKMDILVAEELKQAFEKAKVKGINLIEPSKYYP